MIGVREHQKGYSGSECPPCSCHFLSTMKLSRLMALVFALLFASGLVFIFFNWPSPMVESHDEKTRGGEEHYKVISRSDRLVHSENAGSGLDPGVDAARKTLGLIDWTQLSGPELHSRLDELVRIKHSVQAELRGLESQRADSQNQLAALAKKIDTMKGEASKAQSQLDRLQLSIEQAKLSLRELNERNAPDLLPPIRLTALNTTSPNSGVSIIPSLKEGSGGCTMSTCFDFSRCPLSSGFPVYVKQDESTPQSFVSAVEMSGYRTLNPKEACITVVFNSLSGGGTNQNDFYTAGMNYLIFDLDGRSDGDSASTKAPSAAIRVSLSNGNHRPGYDFAVPRTEGKYSEDDGGTFWRHLPPLVPLRRNFLYSFHATSAFLKDLRQSNPGVAGLIEQALESVNFDRTDDRVSVSFTCRESLSDPSDGLCDTPEARADVLTQSTFSIVVWPLDTSQKRGALVRMNEAFQLGSIPVIICLSDCSSIASELPFGELLDYRRSTLFVPLARLPELHFLLRSIPDPDLFSMRNQGRMVFSNYLGSTKNIILTALNALRHRLGIQASAFVETQSAKVYDEATNPAPMMDTLPPSDAEAENLGPLEPPRPSPQFTRNYSSMMSVDAYTSWNGPHWGSAFRLAPHTPWDPILPSDAKFRAGSGSALGFRPINGGEGGSGKEFSQALGGNTPQEHFTVVMLTYQREQVMIDSLTRLHGLPYLNKVIVVWNNPLEAPSEDVRWPDIGVPVVVIQAEKNSLNNRFLPFEEIDTEAVLSVDDDAHLRHDEIIFGFRVWREHRDRLVGFPGRFHAWDAYGEGVAWNYNSNYSCELSMVLTGAAFYHKYYSYAYSELMPQAIRDKVDEYMNCEDLAMNFLISHLTRAPPVKVTSRWTFRCPGCPVTLSEDDSHFQERHKCINFFEKVYGYMPLLYTQYRADSVLFKTRIPQDKQKCFKFI